MRRRRQVHPVTGTASGRSHGHVEFGTQMDGRVALGKVGHRGGRCQHHQVVCHVTTNLGTPTQSDRSECYGSTSLGSGGCSSSISICRGRVGIETSHNETRTKPSRDHTARLGDGQKYQSDSGLKQIERNAIVRGLSVGVGRSGHELHRPYRLSNGRSQRERDWIGPAGPGLLCQTIVVALLVGSTVYIVVVVGVAENLRVADD
jgi:hypothetical protein